MLHHTHTVNGRCFTLDTSVLPAHAIKACNNLIVLEQMDWYCSDWTAEQVLSRRNIRKSEWVVVGEFYQDTTYFCDCEQKWEYCSDEKVLLAPASLQSEHTVCYMYEERAADAGYTEYA